MTVDEIREWIDENIPLATEDYANARRVAPNSYGTGYDCGYLFALTRFKKFVNGEEE